MGSVSTLIYTAELILCFTIRNPKSGCWGNTKSLNANPKSRITKRTLTLSQTALTSLCLGLARALCGWPLSIRVFSADWHYLVNKPFRRLVCRLIMSADERLTKANEYLAEKRSFEGKCEILRTISQPRTLSADIPASQKGVYLFCNPSINFYTFQHAWLTVLPALCFQVRLQFSPLSSMLKLHEDGWL